VGRPGIDSGGLPQYDYGWFFEDLPSNGPLRLAAAFDVDSGVFLKYELNEKTPGAFQLPGDPSAVGLEIYERIFRAYSTALGSNGLLRARTWGLMLLIEANASLRALVHRNTEEQYWDYVKRLPLSRALICRILGGAQI